jgi:hypothetical protein
MWSLSHNTRKVLFLAAALIALVLGAWAALEVPASLPASELRLARIRSLLGLFFLGFPLWAWFKAPDSPARLLAIFGLCFGFLLMGAPSFESRVMRGVLDSVAILALYTGITALVHFLLLFPSRHRFLSWRWAPVVLYAPAVTVVLVSIATLVVSIPTASRYLGMLFIIFGAVYLVSAIVLLIWRYVAAKRAERAMHGLGLMLGSTLAVFGPLLLYPVFTNVWPDSVRFYRVIYSMYSPPLTLPLIPIAFSVAAVRSARSRRGA